MSSAINARQAKPDELDSPPQKRTQEERSADMRKRLIQATVANLAEQGYAATTLSSIVRRAGVSRGAQVHHYATKTDLILDSARYLLNQTYRQLGDVLLGIGDENDRLRALVDASVNLIVDQPAATAFMELVVTGRHDADLASALQSLTAQLAVVMRGPVDHYFEAVDENSESPINMFGTLLVQLTGLSAAGSLLPEKVVKAQIDSIYRQIQRNIRVRPGVKQPPPPPRLFLSETP